VENELTLQVTGTVCRPPPLARMGGTAMRPQGLYIEGGQGFG